MIDSRGPVHKSSLCITFWYTVYPKKYAHGFVVLCFVVVMQSFIMNSHAVFIHIHQGCFAGTGAIVRLPQCQWSKPDGYGKISQCITTAKHSKANTVCIYLEIYCKCISQWRDYIWGLVMAIKISSPNTEALLHVSHNSSPPGQIGRHFADDIIRCIFMYEKICILIKVSLRLVPNDPIGLAPIKRQTIIWTSADPNYLTHLCGTWRSRVNSQAVILILVTFKLISRIHILPMSCEITLKCMLHVPIDATDG